MDELNRRIVIDQIMFRGAAVSGCNLPQTEMFANIIAEQITNFILDFGFSDYTLAEFTLALHFNASGKIKNPMGEDIEQVQFYGNCINLTYLAKVFGNYNVIRNNFDARLKNLIDGYE